MTVNADMQADIEREETWLRQTLPADPPAPLERVKLRVRIEVHQVWVERHFPADPLPADLGSVKRVARAEAEGGAATTRAGGRRWRSARWMVGWAAVAAAVGFTVGLSVFRFPRSTPNGAALAVRLDDWVEAVTLDEPAVEDPSADWASLEDGIASLEMSLGMNGSSTGVQQELDDLDDEIEVLLTEMG
jgi:hypothetical protein